MPVVIRKHPARWLDGPDRKQHLWEAWSDDFVVARCHLVSPNSLSQTTTGEKCPQCVLLDDGDGTLAGPAEFDIDSVQWRRLLADGLTHAWSPPVDAHRPGWCDDTVSIPVAEVADDGAGRKCLRCQNAVTRSLVAARPRTCQHSRPRTWPPFRTSSGGFT